jgi:signal transduction histidine kinase
LLLAETQRTREEQARSALLAERVRLSREVHDVLAHTLSGLAIQLETAEAILSESAEPAAALDVIRRSRRLVVEGMDETRRAVSALRGDSTSVERGLVDLLERIRAQGTVAELEIDGEQRALPADVQLALLRIAREAVTNAQRHASGTPVAVRLRFDATETVMTIRNVAADDGRNGAVSGYGITGMRERAALVGGELDTGRRDGAFVVEARVPG